MDICGIKLTDHCRLKINSPARKTWGNCTQLDLHSQNKYNHIVKVTKWEKYKESLPIDVDPYDPAAFDLHYSHYKNIGGDKSPINYTTTTQAMLKQISKRNPELENNPKKAVFNLYSDMNEYCEGKKQSICPSASRPDFITTMQDSYQPPYPYILKRLSMAEPPYFLHRYVTENVTGKFWDDNFKSHTAKLQKYKGSKHVSFNPFTGYYTDETLGDMRSIC